ncbi:ATP-binding cassette domain-containing protein, partial [Caulobacter sp. 17J65-9]|uniref:ATP-binding cassette domain-containing protein n=1 Tax=Caulobacter sp. 17J65-9 TaxID=2709382 RepID=UPI0013C5438D
MPAFATLDRVSAVTPDGRTLFDNLSLAFGPERIGVVGRNGSGKTTLLRLLAGEATPASGAVSFGGRVGVLRQSLPLAPGDTVADALGVAEGLARLDLIEQGCACEADFEAADWLLPSRLETALAEAGLGAIGLDREAATLSGGERTRVALAALLVDEPDLILLDEPTNNLDAEAKGAVARLLEGWRKGAVVVSHDRELLRGVDRVLELSSLGARLYGGGWDHYAERRDEERDAAERGLDAAERELRRVEREGQTAREKKARRDSAGRRDAARGGAPKILLGARKANAENSAGRESRVADRL